MFRTQEQSKFGEAVSLLSRVWEAPVSNLDGVTNQRDRELQDFPQSVQLDSEIVPFPSTSYPVDYSVSYDWSRIGLYSLSYWQRR